MAVLNENDSAIVVTLFLRRPSPLQVSNQFQILFRTSFKKKFKCFSSIKKTTFPLYTCLEDVEKRITVNGVLFKVMSILKSFQVDLQVLSSRFIYQKIKLARKCEQNGGVRADCLKLIN